MSQTLIISDELHARLLAIARKRGLKTVEELLEQWQASEDDLLQRQHVVGRIDVLRTQLLAKYGEMPDSTTLIGDDRMR